MITAGDRRSTPDPARRDPWAPIESSAVSTGADSVPIRCRGRNRTLNPGERGWMSDRGPLRSVALRNEDYRRLGRRWAGQVGGCGRDGQLAREVPGVVEPTQDPHAVGDDDVTDRTRCRRRRRRRAARRSRARAEQPMTPPWDTTTTRWSGWRSTMRVIAPTDRARSCSVVSAPGIRPHSPVVIASRKSGSPSAAFWRYIPPSHSPRNTSRRSRSTHGLEAEPFGERRRRLVGPPEAT